MSKDIKSMGFPFMKLKRHELENFMKIFSNQGLLSLSGNKFSYFMERNYRKIQDEIKIQQKFNEKLLKKRGNISKEYLAAEKEIIDQYCVKDANGNPQIQNGMFNIPNEEMEEFLKSKEAALGSIPEFAAETAKIEAYNKAIDLYMDGEISIIFHNIREEDIPVNITGAQRILISDYIV